MREKLKKIVAYIFRSWEDEPGYTHPRLKILPPFLLELFSLPHRLSYPLPDSSLPLEIYLTVY